MITLAFWSQDSLVPHGLRYSICECINPFEGRRKHYRLKIVVFIRLILPLPIPKTALLLLNWNIFLSIDLAVSTLPWLSDKCHFRGFSYVPSARCNSVCRDDPFDDFVCHVRCFHVWRNSNFDHLSGNVLTLDLEEVSDFSTFVFSTSSQSSTISNIWHWLRFANFPPFLHLPPSQTHLCKSTCFPLSERSDQDIGDTQKKRWWCWKNKRWKRKQTPFSLFISLSLIVASSTCWYDGGWAWWRCIINLFTKRRCLMPHPRVCQ